MDLESEFKKAWGNRPLQALDIGHQMFMAGAALSQPSPTVPFGYHTGHEWGNRQSEQVMKITRKAQPEHGFTHALYAAPQPTEPALDILRQRPARGAHERPRIPLVLRLAAGARCLGRIGSADRCHRRVACTPERKVMNSNLFELQQGAEQFRNGAKAMFDALLMRAANNWHARPEARAVCDAENKLIEEWAAEALEDVSPDDHTAWKSIGKAYAEGYERGRRETPTPQPSDAPQQGAAEPEQQYGYDTAFYELASLMGIGAQSTSPEIVWREQMFPRLQAAFAKTEPVGTLDVHRFRGHLENTSFDYTGSLPDGTYRLYATQQPQPAEQGEDFAQLREAAECVTAWNGYTFVHNDAALSTDMQHLADVIHAIDCRRNDAARAAQGQKDIK